MGYAGDWDARAKRTGALLVARQLSRAAAGENEVRYMSEPEGAAPPVKGERAAGGAATREGRAAKAP